MEAAIFRSVLVSSPGKVILHGEHAVVYGKPAIATSADLRCFLLLKPTRTGTVALELPDMQLKQAWGTSQLCDLLGYAEDEQLDVLKQFCGVEENPSMQNLACLVLLYLVLHIWGDQLRDSHGAEVIVSSQIPFGAGLGSSAAYSVCLSAALLASSGQIRDSQRQSYGASSDSSSSNCRHFQVPSLLREKLAEDGGVVVAVGDTASWTQEELQLVNKWGYEAEKLIHGTPSGIDNSISVYGGAIRFQSGQFSSLKHMPRLGALVVYTKVPRSTKKMVAAVRQRYETYPSIVEPVLTSIEEIVLKAETTLHQLCVAKTAAEQEQLHSVLQDLSSLNHHLLNAMGVGHQALDRVCHLAAEAGLAAKLTGAGGGGCAVVLLPPGLTKERLDKLKAQTEAAGFECWETSVGGGGVALHT